MKRKILMMAVLAGFVSMGALADVTVTVDEGAMTFGFMNVFNLPAPDGDGAFQFGSGWGVGDLSATFDSATQVTMIPNSIGDPDPYWYIGGGGPGAAGNKIMDANLYAEVTDGFAGQTVTFAGNVLANTLTEDHTAIAFIKDFAPDYSSFNVATAPLTGGAFSFDLATDAGAGRHVQYGIAMTGVNVWVTDLAPYGSVVVEAIPEPATLGLLTIAGCGLWIRRRMRG